MHRATPNHSSFRAYSAGGARAAMHDVNDGFKMQTGKANGMKNETRENIEAPQNYGFTSVIADAEKGANNFLKSSAEAVMNFMGGNRSFPFITSMDDRRHRLWNLAKDAAKGASAMFGQKEWGQQFLNTEKGMFMTGNTEKKMRFQLVQNQNGQKQQQQPGSGAAGLMPIAFRSLHSGVEFEIEVVPLEGDAGSGTTGGGADGTGQDIGSKPTGQKTLHKEQSDTYTDMTNSHVQTTRGKGNHSVQDDKIINYHQDETHSSFVTDKHVHMRFEKNFIWVDKDGCWSSQPIQVKKDDHPHELGSQAGAGEYGSKEEQDAAEGGGDTGGDQGQVTSASPPLNVSDTGNLSLNYAPPLSVTPSVSAARSMDEFAVLAPDTLYLKIADPLYIDSEGRLTSSAEGTVGPPGPAGPAGPVGPAGQGVPTGGTSGQVLTKNSSTNYDTSWITPTSGGGSGNVISSGTPTAGQLAAWTDATHIQGLSAIDGGTF